MRGARAGGFALADQGAFSAATFLINVLLARWMLPDDYGAFTVVFSAYLLMAACHSALFIEPMLVHGAEDYGDRYADYLGFLIRWHVQATMVLGGALVAVGLVTWRFFSDRLAVAVIGLGAATPALLLLWLLRRAFYPRFRPHWAALGSLSYACLAVVGAYALYSAGLLSPFSILLWLVAASLLPSTGLLVLLRPTLAGGEIVLDVEKAAQRHWDYGRWSLGTAVLMWVPGNVYYLILPIWGGLEASGAMRAVINFVTAVIRANAAIAVILIPYFAGVLANQGRRGVTRSALHLLAGLTAVAVLYSGGLIALGDRLFELVYSGRFANHSELLIVASLLPLASAVVAVVGSLLRAGKRPDLVFRSHVAATLLTLTVGIPLTALYGVSGALIGFVVSYATSAALMSWYCFLGGKGTPGRRSVDDR